MATALPELGDKPGLATLTLQKGEGWSKVLTLRTQSGVLDLTGSTFDAAIRDTPVECTVESATVGQIRLTISEVVSASLQAGEYEDDACGQHPLTVKYTPSGGTRRTLLKITVRVVQ